MSMLSPQKTIAFTWRGRACGVNNKYMTRGYVLTKAYRDFRDGIALTCRAANPGQRLEGDVSIALQLRIDPARDSDSLLKPIFDGIEQSGVIDNDNQITNYKVAVTKKKRGEDDEVRAFAWQKRI